MIKDRRKVLMSIMAIFIIFTVVLLFPSVIFAQEEDTAEEELAEPKPEELIFNMNYQEVSAYGIIGERFEFKVDVTLDAPEEQYFEILTETPPGWSIQVNPSSKNVDIPIILLKPDKTESLTIICRPRIQQDPGEYSFKLTLRSTSEEKVLEKSIDFIAVVKPAGVINLTTIYRYA